MTDVQKLEIEKGRCDRHTEGQKEKDLLDKSTVVKTRANASSHFHPESSETFTHR